MAAACSSNLVGNSSEIKHVSVGMILKILTVGHLGQEPD